MSSETCRQCGGSGRAQHRGFTTACEACLRREFAAQLAASSAKAWDEGEEAGQRHQKAITLAYEMGHARLPRPPVNPYRLPAKGDDGEG